jgi:hypothetical protein
MSLTKSKQRVADHGEVFTPEWMVEAMLDLVKGETERIDSRFLEPACGSGNFLVKILQRKLAAVELKYGKSDFERRHFALLALMCIYGIELLPDNIAECRANLLQIFAGYLDLQETDDLYLAAFYVLTQNLVHGDAMKMLTHDGQPITFAEWGYVKNGKFERRDFSLKSLALMSSLRKVDDKADTEGRRQSEMFAEVANHEVFQPTGKKYASMKVADLAAMGADPAEREGGETP